MAIKYFSRMLCLNLPSLLRQVSDDILQSVFLSRNCIVNHTVYHALCVYLYYPKIFICAECPNKNVCNLFIAILTHRKIFFVI